MKLSQLVLLALVPLAACNSTDYRNAVELRYAQTEPSRGSVPDDPDGFGLAYTVTPRAKDKSPIGFEFGIGRQEGDLGFGAELEYENLWAGALVELGEQQLRPFFGGGAIRVSTSAGGPNDLEGFGFYMQGGLRAYATPDVHLTLGYRTTFEVEDGSADLDANQLFFGVGVGF